MKKKRRAVSKSQSKKCDFELFLQNAINGYALQRLAGASVDFRCSEDEKFHNDNAKSESDAAEAEATTTKDGGKNKHITDWENSTVDIMTLWNELGPEEFSAASLLIELQDSLQALGENLVLSDKLAYLHEQREKSNDQFDFKLFKVTNENISPRCFALLANKI